MQKYLKGINPEFAKVFVEGKDAYKPFIMGEQVKLFKMENESDYVSTETEFTPIGLLPKVEVDGSNRSTTVRLPGYDMTWTQEMFSQGVKVTYMQAKFNKYKEQLNVWKSLVTSAQKTKDAKAFAMLVENATGPDGKGLIDNDHTYPAGTALAASTWSNVVMNGSVQAELGPEAIRLGRKYLSSHQLSDNTPATSSASNLALVVGPELAELGQVLCQTEKVPLSGNNDVNVYNGIMKLVVSPWLSTANGGDDDMWFLVDLDVADLRVKISEDVTKTEDLDTASLVKSYYVHEIFSTGPGSSRGIVGALNPGAAWS